MKTKKIRNFISKIWKDPVWSKVISTIIILIITTVIMKLSNYSFKDILNLLITFLLYKIPVFIFLSLISIYLIIKLIIRFFKNKPDPLWAEQVGNYTFKELYNILSNRKLNIRTNGMKWSNKYPSEDSLLLQFHTFALIFNTGLDIDNHLEDGGYLYGVVAPALLGYGLLDKIESQNINLETVTTKFQTSEMGYRFFALLEKTTYLDKNKKVK